MKKQVEKRGENRESVIFYGNDTEYTTPIAEIETENTVYRLVATGEIKATYKGEIYKNGEIEDLIQKHDLKDEDLKDLEYHNNNWFEVIWNEGDRWQSEIGSVRFTYDEAIEMLKDYAQNEERP